MNTTSTQISMPIIALATSGALLLIIPTALALRPRRVAQAFAWITVASVSCPLLALAAAMHMPATDGLRAAVMQLLAVLLAAALGATFRVRPRGNSNSSQSPLSAAARAVAWLTLVGLPPTAGFHGRILVYRALLAAGWEKLAVLAMVGAAAALLPGLWAMRSPSPPAMRGPRAAVAIALMVAILVLGLYPGAGLMVAGLVANLATAS